MREQVAKLVNKWMMGALVIILVAVVYVIPTKAETLTHGPLTYTVSKTGEITITDCADVSGEVIVPEKIDGCLVTRIGDMAFYGCRSITSVIIPEGVTEIGNYTFFGCSSLSSVAIPKTVSAIGEDAFRNCNNLSSVYISELSVWCTISFETDFSTPMYYAKNLYLNGELITDIEIPEGVTSIGNNAFYNCASLQTVTLPQSLTTINPKAFEGCSRLSCINIPKNVTSIGAGAFSNCNSITRVDITDFASFCGIDYGDQYTNLLSKGVKLYLNDVLVNLKDLVIPEGVIKIGSYAFSNCNDVVSISLPRSLNAIGGGVFLGCNNLKDVHIKDLRAWCEIEFESYFANGLYYADNLYINDKLVEGELIIPEGTTHIGEHAFEDYKKISTVIIPNSVTSIGRDAFADCINLIRVIVPDSVTSIGLLAFNNCSEDFAICLKSDYVKNYAESNDIMYYIVPDSITIMELPTKTTYYLGEEFDSSGMILRENYYDGSYKGRSLYGCTISGFDSTKEGTCRVVIACPASYDWNAIYETSLDVTVTRYIQSHDFVVDKKIYRVGDSCDLIGKNMKVTYANGEGGVTTESITIDSSMVSGFDTASAGVKNISICYYNIQIEYSIVVLGNESDYDMVTNIWYDAVHEYTGNAITPEVTVSFENDLLVENEDYILTYENNIEYGNNAKIIITGINLCEGMRLVREFSITKKDISSVVLSKIENQVYTGKAIEPEVTVSIDGKQLERGVDYEVQYIDNIAVGSATVKVIGIGSYLGESTSTFSIKEPANRIVSLGNHSASYSIDVYEEKINFKADKMCTLWELTTLDSDNIVRTGQYSSYSLNNNFVINFSELPKGTYVLFYQLCSYGTTTKLVQDGYGNWVYRNVYSPSGNYEFFAIVINNKEPLTKLPTQITSNVPIANGLRECYLTVAVEPEDAMVDEITWSSSDESIATVSDGKVVYKKAGTVTISAQINGLTATWDLEIEPLNLNMGGSIFNYNKETGKVVVVYDGTILEEDKDYVISITEKQGLTIVKVEGCNLFAGRIVKTYYADSENPYVCEHTYGAWLIEGTFHWKECSVCGHIVKMVHTAGKQWLKDEMQHWHECDECSCKVDISNHTYGEWLTDGTHHWRICTVCGYTTSKMTHTMSADWLVQDTVHWKECMTCGHVEQKVHTAGTQWLKDETQHWHECDTCSCKVDISNHTYGEWLTDGTYHWRTCVICGYTTSKMAHSLGDWQVSIPATTESEGVEKRICSVCSHEETRAIPKVLCDMWKEDEIGWRYQYADGSYPYNCWKLIDNKWYYFDPSGYRVANSWRKDSKGWVYLGADGAMLTNAWCTDSSGWCYVGPDGYAVTNCWKKDSIGWIWLNSNGSMTKSSWIKDAGKWYYLDANGYMVSNSWRKDSKGWVYLGASGAMLTNAWCTDSQGWCYVGSDGYAVTNCWKKDSVGWIWLNSNGSMTKSAWIKDGGKWYYLDARGYMVTGRQFIGNKWYNFNSSGVWVG